MDWTGKNSRKQLFLNKVFVISSNENTAELTRRIVNCGGIVRKRLNSVVDYFVQSYNVEDDGRLEKVRDLSIQVVPVCWLNDCITYKEVLTINLHALCSQNEDSVELGDTFKKIFHLFDSPRDEWREEEELPQCFQDFASMPDKITPTESKPKLYVLPMIALNKSENVMKRTHSSSSNFQFYFNILVNYLTRYFQVPISLFSDHYIDFKSSAKMAELKASDVTAKDLPKLKNSKVLLNSQKELNALSVIDILVDNIPPDGFALIGITNWPIFENGNEAKIYGRATGDGGCIISIKNLCSSGPSSPRNTKKQKIAKPSTSHYSSSSSVSDLSNLNCHFILGTATHELMHCLGLDHCPYFACNLNACCDEEVVSPEDNPPLLLCPICLKKLQLSLNFSVVNRYKDLVEFFHEFNFQSEFSCVNKLIHNINKM